MWFLAVRYLLSRKRQTVLILLGIVLGTAAYVTISGMMLGFQSFLLEQLVNNDASIRISAREEIITERSLDTVFYPERPSIRWLVPPSGRRDSARIDYVQGWFDRLDREPQVVAYTPQLTAQVILRYGQASEAAKLIGTDPSRQLRVTNIADYMTAGRFDDIGRSGNRLVVSTALLEKLGARRGETLWIAAGQGAPRPFKVVATFNTGIKQLDETTLFGAISDVQQLRQTPSFVSDIAVRIADYHLAKPLALRWQTGSRERVQSWDQINTGTLSIFKTQNFIRHLMTFSLLAVAGFGIYNVLNMMITHKRGEIAILRSIGYEARDVGRLFLTQGLVLGILGGLIGLGIGYLACRYIATIEVDPGRFNKGGKMTVSFATWIYLRGCLQAVAAAIIASLLPARAAARLRPVEILRAEVG